MIPICHQYGPRYVRLEIIREAYNQVWDIAITSPDLRTFQSRMTDLIIDNHKVLQAERDRQQGGEWYD